MVEAMDTEMARLFNSMDASVLANTNIIFIGDNGTPGQVSPGVVNSAKGTLYEGGVHVPFIVSGPVVNGALNRTHDALIHVVDLFDTIAEMAGVDVGAVLPSGTALDSLSIVDYLTNANQANYHPYAFTEQYQDPIGNNDGVTIRNENYKLIYFGATGDEALYQLNNDPAESNDLNDGSLSAVEQNNYNSLISELDILLHGGDDGGSDTEIIDSEDFESNWGIWNDGGNDARRNASDAAYANSGNFCIRLRDNSSTSVVTSDALNLSGYSEITVDFSYYVSLFNRREDFWLQVSTDGGNTFTTVGEWNRNDEFVNDQRSEGSVTVGNLTSTTVLRFRCDASNNNDLVYIDDVMITGTLD